MTMDLRSAKREALRLANLDGRMYAVVVTEGAEVGLLGNNRECEVVSYRDLPYAESERERIVMAVIGPGALLDG